MFTVNDIKEAEFEKSMRGYRPEAVQDFLAQIAAQIEHMNTEKEDLEKKLYILAGKVEEYRGEEDMLKTAMINAQRMGESVIREARQKAENIVREADLKANLIDEKSKEKLRAEEEKFVQLQKKVADFKAEVLAIYKTHIEALSELPVFDIEQDDEEINAQPAFFEETPRGNEKYYENDADISEPTVLPYIEPDFARNDDSDLQPEALEAIEENSESFNEPPLNTNSFFANNFSDDDYTEIPQPVDDTSDLDKMFGLNGVGYESVALDSMPHINEEPEDETDDVVLYEKPSTGFTAFDDFSDDKDENDKNKAADENSEFNSFLSFDEDNDENIEKPPLKSSIFDKFNGINFKD